MAIQYVDKNADAVTHIGDTYDITVATDDLLRVAIDGGGDQDFTLTPGVARTAAQIVTDLAGLTGATASVVTVNGVNYVRIRTTSASGASSTIEVKAPATTANATLGFVTGVYTGGANVSSTFVTSSRQNVVDGIEDALNAAGWITISGHHSANTLVQSSMSPDSQNLRMRIRLKDNGATNCAVASIENVSGTKAGGNSTTAGLQFLFGSSKTWRIIANKYQAFVFVPTTTASREFAAWGIPMLPTWLDGGVVYEAIWAHGNAVSDTDGTVRGSFRTGLGTRDSNACGNCQMITNNNLVEVGNASTTDNIGLPTLVVMVPGTQLSKAALSTHYRWHGSSAYMTDPIISWGLTATTDEGMGRGQLWDAFVSMEQFTIDTAVSALDSHDWWGITNDNVGTASSASRGTLFIAVT